MIIIQVMGGLGNQLQQYALYRKFVRLGKEARLDLSWFDALPSEAGEVGGKQRETGGKAFSGATPKAQDEAAPADKAQVTRRELELSYFDRLIYEVCTQEERERLIGREDFTGKLRRKLLPGTVHWFHESRMYHPEILQFEDMYLSGYFACEKYYADILYDLQEKIQFPVSDNPRNRQLAQEMHSCPSVSVHIRRGDYLNPENQAMFGGICTDAYYKKALELMREEVPGVRFYIFSDDIPYVKQQYQGEEYTIVDVNHGKDSFYDMWLMSNCRHHICANSTFSFWGARLNPHSDKIMIRPTIQKNSQVFNREEMEELWAGWRFVDAKGKER